MEMEHIIANRSVDGYDSEPVLLCYLTTVKTHIHHIQLSIISYRGAYLALALFRCRWISDPLTILLWYWY